MPKHHLAGLWAIRALFVAIVNIEHIDNRIRFCGFRLHIAAMEPKQL